MLRKKQDDLAPIMVMEEFLCSLLASGCISETQRTELKDQLERRSGYLARKAELPDGVADALTSLARLTGDIELSAADDEETARQMTLARIDAKLDVALAAISILLMPLQCNPYTKLESQLYSRTANKKEVRKREHRIGVEAEYQKFLSRTIERVLGEEG
jgi:hypothetical protein